MGKRGWERHRWWAEGGWSWRGMLKHAAGSVCALVYGGGGGVDEDTGQVYLARDVTWY